MYWVLVNVLPYSAALIKGPSGWLYIMIVDDQCFKRQILHLAIVELYTVQ
jgi:hypothetical protein